MIAVRYILLLALAFTLQTTWVNFLEVWSVKPDLLILTLSYIALRSGPVVGAYMGLGVGLLQDIYLPADLDSMRSPSRSSARVLAIATLGMSPTASKSNRAGFGAVICHDLIYYVFASVDSPFEVGGILGRAVYTGLINAVFFAGLALKRHLFPA